MLIKAGVWKQLTMSQRHAMLVGLVQLKGRSGRKE